MNSYVASAYAVILVNCAARETLPLTTTTSAAAKAEVSNETAIKELTSERCARAFSCGDVGDARAWTDMDACSTDVRRSTRDYLARQTCDKGIAMGERFASCDAVSLCH